ncbi:hypothetical protein WJX74_005392 [Apatococcus lobatus]|uniref:protein-tyrosine-phosphatase n=2 Tax=Apatococcus TaxID=904362 RepID=A0AAW1SLP3_9CHLO
MRDSDPFTEALPVVAEHFYCIALKSTSAIARSSLAASGLLYCIDRELTYEPFYEDFGPLNLGQAYRFCCRTTSLRQEASLRKKPLYFFTGNSEQQRANAAVLVGLYQVLLLDRTPELAFQTVKSLGPFAPFRDASCGQSCFDLSVLDCLKGISKARQAGFLDWHLPSCSFDVEEYELHEQVQNGDFNWIVPGKLLAFSGPASTIPLGQSFYRQWCPEDYTEFFRSRNITTIVRLNKQTYDSRRFTSHGFTHHELYFPDGSCPSLSVMRRFLDIVEKEPGALAIHCKAGLGRTGVLICCYMIKHYGFTAEEAIGYIRICRPGSVIGPQQTYLLQHAQMLLAEGRSIRQARQRADALQQSQASSDAMSTSGNFGLGPLAAGLAEAVQPDTPPRLSSRLSGASSITGPPSANRASVDVAATDIPRQSRVSDFLRSRSSTALRGVRTMGRTISLEQAAPTTPPGTRPVLNRAVTSPAPSMVRLTASSGSQPAQPPGRTPAELKISSNPRQRPMVNASVATARALAPNGQPRKVPASLLSSGGKPKDLRPLLDGEDPAQLQITSQPWSITADRPGSRF